MSLITGTAILTGVARKRLEIRPNGMPCVDIPIDRPTKFTAYLVAADGTSTEVNARWSTTAGIIDSNGVLTPDAKIGTYSVTATQL